MRTTIGHLIRYPLLVILCNYLFVICNALGKCQYVALLTSWLQINSGRIIMMLSISYKTCSQVDTARLCIRRLFFLQIYLIFSKYTNALIIVNFVVFYCCYGGRYPLRCSYTLENNLASAYNTTNPEVWQRIWNVQKIFLTYR